MAKKKETKKTETKEKLQISMKKFDKELEKLRANKFMPEEADKFVRKKLNEFENNVKNG